MDNKSPLVSVLMTAYNREAFIGEAIRSVLESSFADFELIVVDDGSTDQTVTIARGFESHDSRIKVFVNDQNLGDYNNRNKAASLANGKYLKYLDSDDIIYKYSLAIMVEAMEKFPNCSYAFTFPHQIDQAPFPLEYTPMQSYKEHFFSGGFFDAGPGGTIILKSAFDEIGGFSGIRMVGDYELWLALGAKYNVLKIQPHLIWWRRHEGQEFKLGMQTNLYLKFQYGISVKALNSAGCPLPIPLRNAAINKCKRVQSRAVMRLLAKGDFKAGLEILQFSSLKYKDLLTCLLPYSRSPSNIGNS